LGDLVHLTHRAQATLLVRKPPCPTVVTVHDIIHFQLRADPSMRLYRNRFVQWMDRMSISGLRNADAVIASSDYTRRALIKEIGLAEANVHCIHLGVDSEQFHPCQIPESFLERYALDRDVQYILHISTEEPRKNFLALIRAFALVRARHPYSRLLKVGWPLYPDMRRQALALVNELDLRDSVILLDDVPDKDLVYFYNLARVFAFPSYAEGFGLPVLEAMACGTPVVCSDRASLPELVGDAALMVDPDDTGGLAEALSTLLADERLRTNLRDAGLARATQFSWTRTAHETIKVYHSFL
jgi:glycosyltransferase involved in cell wall biosynthesis